MAKDDDYGNRVHTTPTAPLQLPHLGSDGVGKLHHQTIGSIAIELYHAV